MKDIYNVLYLIDTPFVITNLETEELAKYVTNSFLATKISFINEIANIAEGVSANRIDVTRCMGLDGRIGNKFLHPRPGFGGSCFPKDTSAIAKMAEETNYNFEIIKAVIKTNRQQKLRIVKK